MYIKPLFCNTQLNNRTLSGSTALGLTTDGLMPLYTKKKKKKLKAYVHFLKNKWTIPPASKFSFFAHIYDMNP